MPPPLGGKLTAETANRPDLNSRPRIEELLDIEEDVPALSKPLRKERDTS